MRHVRLGYACINLTLGNKGRTSHTCRIANATHQRLEELARANLIGLSEILRWNVAQHIEIFRISSTIIPLASHPTTQWPWLRKLGREISRIGDYVEEHKLRLSMHPGQYTVLNSSSENVVAAAMAELAYHARFLEALGLSQEHKIVLHVGGVYGDRDTSLQRFRDNFCLLPSKVKSRLVLENDERSYNVEDVLALCESLDIPMVFDYLHHRANHIHPLRRGSLDRVYATWSVRDGRPKLHFSTQKPRARIGAHADMINSTEFIRFLKTLPQRDADVMLEAKRKDRALLKLRENLQSRPIAKQFNLG
jgi:UV DNA damage endonuclease